MTTDRTKIVEELRSFIIEWYDERYHPGCNLIAADLIEQDGQRIAALEAEIERLGRSAIEQVSRLAREAGEAKGRLEASEMAGVVEGWKARCLAAEAEIAKLKGTR